MRLSALCKHCSVWKGIAMLWIVFYHSKLLGLNRYISLVQNSGYGGVDIFMFASGLGAYFSYTKDYNPTAFMQRRLKRLVPVYFPFIVIWIFYRFLRGGFPVQAAIGNILAVQGFTGLGNKFNWYITGLLVVYILTPFFSGLIDRINKFQFIFLIVVLLIISIPFQNSHDAIIIVTRLPIFAIGMYFAKLSKNDEQKLTRKLAVVLAVAMVAGFMLLMLFRARYQAYLWMYGLYWYPFILITPGLCIFSSVFAEIVCKINIVKGFLKILKKVGEYSFECFLIHIFCLDVYRTVLIPAQILPSSNWAILLVLVCVIPLCVLLHACSKGVVLIINAIRFRSKSI